MLLRVSLAVRETPKRKRWARLLRHSECSLRVLSGDELDWEKLVQNLQDLLVLDEGLIPEADPNAPEMLGTLGQDLDSIVVTCTFESAMVTYRAAGVLGCLLYGAEDKDIRSAWSTMIQQRRSLLTAHLETRRRLARPELSDFVTHSPAMKDFILRTRRLCHSEVPVLITGETGAGKERLARSLHAASPRAGQPFLAVNCGAISENLMESELFGHVEGAFTGASRDRRGCFELAHRGTLFLDEIGEIPRNLQAKLLRVLQEFEVTPLGGERSFTVDVRIITATNRDLKQEIEDKNFRLDLFYRIAVLELHLPPLRERREDIRELAETFLSDIAARIGQPAPELGERALEILLAYEWPGNIRELINVMERAILLCDGETITPSHLPGDLADRQGPAMHGSAVRDFLPETWRDLNLKQARECLVDGFERVYLEELLQECAGKVSDVARRAGIDNRTLFNKMKRFGMHKEDYRSPSR